MRKSIYLILPVFFLLSFRYPGTDNKKFDYPLQEVENTMKRRK